MGLTGDYRKYVWNDFSVVEKARIIIIESSDKYVIGSCEPNSNHELKFVKELPVQINPASFSYEYRVEPKNMTRNLTAAKDPGVNFVPVTFGDFERGTTTIPLIFDIYDEYNARSMNSGLDSSMSLMKKGFTSLPDLIEYAKSGNKYALFKWGDIKKFGVLTGVDTEYTAFSPWGQPLKARVSVHITEEPVKGGIDALNAEALGMNGLKEKMSNVSNKGKQFLNGIKNIFR
ncbi:MAG: hypothetical protein Q4D57_01395 [Clostridia bacterium]|nr:hypothetical protein [Clostridia bacterium]